METKEPDEKRHQLKTVADAYFQALRRKDFAAIPYADDVSLRAPLAPGGVNHPLIGKDALQSDWWRPLEPALNGVRIRVLDHYVNDTLTAIVAEAEITLTAVNPPVTLRVADRFTIDADGKILEQENHFDPRDVTNPGWQKA